MISPVEVLRLNCMNVTLFLCLLHGLPSVLYTWQFVLLGSIFEHLYANRADLASDKTSLNILVVQLGSCTCLALMVSSDVVIRERMKSIRTELSTRKEVAPFILTNRVSQEAINLKRFLYINEAPRPGHTKQ